MAQALLSGLGEAGNYAPSQLTGAGPGYVSPALALNTDPEGQAC